MNEKLAEILEKYKNTIVAELKNRVASDDKIATGNLHDSFRGVVEGQSISIYASEYWYVVNYGRKPGKPMPPIRPILEWMKVKGIKESTAKKTKSLAWVIAKKIGDDGIPGTNFFWETINSIVPLITKDIEESYLKDLNDQIDGNS